MFISELSPPAGQMKVVQCFFHFEASGEDFWPNLETFVHQMKNIKMTKTLKSIKLLDK